MPVSQKRSQVMDYIIVAALAMLMALNYQVFILNNAFAPAGLGGINTMIQYVFNFSVGYMSLLINIPLFAMAFWRVDRVFALKTLVNVLVFSGTLLLMQNNIIDVRRFMYHTSDGRSTILAPVARAPSTALSLPIPSSMAAARAAWDYVSAMIHKRKPEFSMVHITFAINLCVAGISYFVYDFKIEPVILCVVYCYLTTRVSDHILKGGKEALKVEMITAHPDEITQHVIRDLRHSATIIHAEGGYSHQGKTMLICIINKHQITEFTKIISQYPDTFACVSSVNETLGNFKKIK